MSTTQENSYFGIYGYMQRSCESEVSLEIRFWYFIGMRIFNVINQNPIESIKFTVSHWKLNSIELCYENIKSGGPVSPLFVSIDYRLIKWCELYDMIGSCHNYGIFKCQ